MNARTLFAAGLQKASKVRHYSLFQGWAALELREGNYQAARKLIAEALTRNKKNGRGWIIAAQIEEQDGHSGLVSLLLRRGIECNPNDAELYRELGEYFVGQGKIDDAREVFEKGIATNPMYAPLYHSLAELEARICNLEALARLNKRAAEIFHNNALEPSPMSSEAFERKVKATHTQHDPHQSNNNRISAFATKIVDDRDDDDDGDDEYFFDLVGNVVDPMSILESLNGDGLVGDMMNID
jgi:Tfp pilus assembly protein PilF